MLTGDGWKVARQRGSHRQFKHELKPGLVTVAGKPGDDVAPGTLNSGFVPMCVDGRLSVRMSGPQHGCGVALVNMYNMPYTQAFIGENHWPLSARSVAITNSKSMMWTTIHHTAT